MKRNVILNAVMLLTSLMFGLSACSQQKQPAKPTAKIQPSKQKKTMKVKELTLDEFKTKVMNFEANPDVWKFEGERPAVIDFYATWCGPCKMTAPVVEELAEKYDGKVDFYKVDVDKEEQLAAMFGIQSIPSLLFIPMKGEPHMSVGAMSFGEMDSVVTEILK